MRICFADTSFFIALVSGDDEAHSEATRVSAEFDGEVVTTEWVLNELANFLARPPNRSLFVQMLKELLRDRRVTVVTSADATFNDGVKLYAERLDKEWSVTDCISFIVMDRYQIRDALTKDHHFEQAGFNCLLK